MNTELKKQAYTAPSIEVIEMENEGAVMTASATGSLGGFGKGETIGGTSGTKARSYNSAGSSDLEDMINDILTVEN
ncbi:hypothetical protein [Bacteroides sp.]|uniref:hypothetical protein n=1 Tax=Bacteroides sp. TaxID=29523 RepID=UPI002612E623|nr:hypothetical protein [Bacteroides sp.]